MRKIAAKHMFDGQEFRTEQCIVLDDDHTIVEVAPAADHSDAYWQPGLLTPGFINAHCHLELSHLQGQIPRHSGMVAFGSHVVFRRNDLPEPQQQAAMAAALKHAYDLGTVAIADISNNGLSASPKRSSPVYTHTFLELLGAQDERARAVFNQGYEELALFDQLSASLTPHAPFSISPTLFTLLGLYADSQEQPYSLHFMETEAELEWVAHGTGPFKAMLESFGVSQKPSATDVPELVIPRLPSISPVLLVHCTETRAEDLQHIRDSRKHIYYCLCPRSNVYIHNRQPSYNLFPWERVCIGTDSLASNDDLDLLQEVLAIQAAVSIPLEALLSALTANPAQYLRLRKAGKLKAKYAPGLLALSGYDADNKTLLPDAKAEQIAPPNFA